MDILAMVRADLGPTGVPHAQIRKVAGKMGVSYFTLRKIVKGYTKEPSYTTGEKIRRYYERRR